MECLLCSMWARMPYAKKYTTPTTVGETEGSLVVGYWVATRQVTEGVVVRLCERHMTVVNALDGQEEARKLAEAQKPADHTLDPRFQQRLADVNQRKEQLIATATAANAPKPEPAAKASPFVLGPGPLVNPNHLVEQPVAPAPAQPPILTGLTVQPAVAPQGPMMPLDSQHVPQAAALIDAPCLFCKVMVMTGEVHNCPQSGARGN
jgi:hypothetical protein